MIFVIHFITCRACLTVLITGRIKLRIKSLPNNVNAISNFL